MDFDEARDFADQGPLPDMDMEEDALIFATLLKHIIFIRDIVYDITYDMQVQGRKTYAGTLNSNAYHHFTGKECLDVHLLKPARVDVLPGQQNVVCADDMPPEPAWLEYPSQIPPYSSLVAFQTGSMDQ